MDARAPLLSSWQMMWLTNRTGDELAAPFAMPAARCCPEASAVCRTSAATATVAASAVPSAAIPASPSCSACRTSCARSRATGGSSCRSLRAARALWTACCGLWIKRSAAATRLPAAPLTRNSAEARFRHAPHAMSWAPSSATARKDAASLGKHCSTSQQAASQSSRPAHGAAMAAAAAGSAVPPTGNPRVAPLSTATKSKVAMCVASCDSAAAQGRAPGRAAMRAAPPWLPGRCLGEPAGAAIRS